MTHSGEFRVYPARRRLRLTALLGVVMTVVSLNAFVSGKENSVIPSTGIIRFFGFLGLLLFGSSTTAVLVRSFSQAARRPER